MKYQFRKHDKVFFKVMVGNSHIPLEDEEVEKLTAALAENKTGLMVFRMGIVRLDKIIGITPDYDRMEDWNINLEKIELPDVSRKMIENSGMKAVQELLSNY